MINKLISCLLKTKYFSLCSLICNVMVGSDFENFSCSLSCVLNKLITGAPSYFLKCSVFSRVQYFSAQSCTNGAHFKMS
uniref:Uncharacterized protein n=1 Tax=Anguilla anguilla TaxID=7936 RepID=A0A0E9WJI4_ANGAN